MNLYVYYRVQPGREDACRTAVTAMQTELGVAPCLLRRADDHSTWMEIYEGKDDAFAARLEETAQRHGLAAFLAGDGIRHCERFVECA